jgi:anaerobic ribonucleoside-triphosphate reductase activating protein
MLNIAASVSATQALGPGWRAAVWVQGCPFRCAGCIAPNWIPLRPARQVAAETLASELLADPRVSGWTLSGGEPMLQARNLAVLVQAGRAQRELNLIVFTGYNLAQLRRMPPGTGIPQLLELIDVLIDGPYQAELNDNRGLRGSSNQAIHYLTDRLRGAGLEEQPRRVEVRVKDGELMLVGVPPLGVLPQ